jgi:hypothetical protein|tara:strand:- start:325 stop:711 length:387 start_codon:yes stop_codon:yes gene_type:complete
MNFKSFLVEDEQVSIASETSLADEKVRDEINLQLNHVLTDVIFSPESGIQKIRKVLHLHGLDMPALYDADTDGDELILKIDQFGGTDQFYLYVVYYLVDDGRYDFYAELTDEEGLNEIMSDEEEDEEE